jgi:GH15 family glucan-1,4-alpha-glucosidase
VDFYENIFLKEIAVENLQPQQREVRLFFVQDFNIQGNNVGDTAAFDPKTGGVVRYKGPCYFLANGSTTHSDELSQFAVGQKGIGGREGTFRDAEDGVLSKSTIAQGSVDSVIGLTLLLEPMSKGKGYYWLAVGQNWEEVRQLNGLVKQKGAKTLIRRTGDPLSVSPLTWSHATLSHRLSAYCAVSAACASARSADCPRCCAAAAKIGWNSCSPKPATSSTASAR